jgi:cation:H+ antiporter
MLLDIALIAAGVVVLYFGGELLVRGSSALARAVGMSPLVVGLTVVAFGTSSPELAATIAANFKGAPAVALGNVIGSNIANLGLILGAAALVLPLVARARFLRRELPFMVVVSALVWPLAADGVVGRLDALLLLAGIALYLAVLLRKGESPEVVEEFRAELGDGRPRVGRSLGAVAAGIGLLVVGAHLLVEGAVAMARGMGVSEAVIGVSLVAVGTSLPELASSLVAAARRESDIALGNLIGSNVFNVLGILGIAALVQPLAVPFAELRADYWVMMGFSLLIVPFLWTGSRVGRIEGAILLTAYTGYIVWRFM